MSTSFIASTTNSTVRRCRPILSACNLTPNFQKPPQSPRASIPTTQPSFEVRRGGSINDNLPTLVFLPGLDSRPLPEFQTEQLNTIYNVISIVPESAQNGENAGWDSLSRAVLETIQTEKFVLVGASFGAALALRVSARAPQRVIRLLLLNSGTALRTAPAVRAVTTMLPILYAPHLYRFAARILTPFLIDHRNLHESVTFSDDGKAVFDIRQVPLDDVRHRVQLLGEFATDFGNECVRNLVTSPTILVASTSDRLLPSKQEARRLKSLLPNVVKYVEIPDVAHAALLDKRVSLRDLLNTSEAKPLDKTATRQRYREAFRAGSAFFEPWRKLHSPWISGLRHVRDALSISEQSKSQRPVLFVGNHGKYGLQDLPLLYIILANELKSSGDGSRRVRGLAHPAHFDQFDTASGGRWAQFMSSLGAVPASARAYYSLLRDGECVLLFPGGAREVCRKQGEEYSLVWGEGTEFVRPAALFDALIVPFCTVGADDDADILLDGDEMQRLPIFGDVLSQALDSTGFNRAELMPLSGPPKLDRFYFEFLPHFDTVNVNARDADQCTELYSQVRKRVEDGVHNLLDTRESDPKRSLLSRIASDTIERFDF